MKIFITGASGFIGRQVISLLDKHELLIVDICNPQIANRSSQYINGDLSQLEKWSGAVRDFAPDACIHLAYKGLPDYSVHLCLENFSATIQLYKLLSDLGCKKVLTAGTCWEYGNLQRQVSEADTTTQMNVFASFKSSQCLIGSTIAAQAGMDFIWARIFFVYGFGQRTSSLIPSCVRTFQQGQIPDIKTPMAINDFIHVTDVARAIAALIDSNNTKGIYNIGSGVPTTVADICKRIADHMGKKGIESNNCSLKPSTGFWADISRINTATGWKPEMSLDAGIQDTISRMVNDQ